MSVILQFARIIPQNTVNYQPFVGRSDIETTLSQWQSK
jgi:hypothetical protein